MRSQHVFPENTAKQSQKHHQTLRAETSERGVSLVSDVSIDQLKEEFGGNEWLVDELYQKFLADPSSVDEKWRSLFEQVKPSNNEKPAAPTANKPAAPAAAKEPAKPASSPKHAAPAAKQEKPAATPAQASPCLLYTSPSPRDATLSRMPSSA